MSLERLVEEIRLRAERELQEEETKARTEEAAIAAHRDRRIQEVQAEGRKLTESEAARERAQRLAAAKLQSRKLVYEARERRTSQQLDTVRSVLSDYAESEEYPQVLKRMFAFAADRLGKQVRVTGRAEDAAVLRQVAGKSFDDSPAPILGGLIAETSDGSRRLNLSFDELLRLREDEVRALLAQ